MRLLATLVMMLGTFALGCGKAHPIALKWEKGASWSQRMTMEVETETAGQGAIAASGTKMTQIWEMRINVIDQDARGAATVESTFTRGRIVSTTPFADSAMTIDSADPASLRNAQKSPGTKVLAEMVKAMAGGSIRYQVTPDGKVQNVSGASALAERASANMTDGKELLNAMMSDESMKDQIEMSLRGIPSQPVKVGENWTSEYSMDMPMVGELAVTTKFKLASIKQLDGHSVATIDITQEIPASTMDMGNQPGMPAMPGMKIERKAAKSKGTQTIDLTLGRITSYSTVMSMDMETHMPAVTGMKEPLKSTATTTITVETIDTPGK